MKQCLITSLIWTLLTLTACNGQPAQTEADPPGAGIEPVETWDYRSVLDSALFPLIDTAHLKIVHPEKLLPFFNKLRQLEHDSLEKVRIVQIGDSHLQAGFQTRQTRYFLQKSFGAGGRGIIFPYRVAGTNSPSDIYSYSNVSWESKRNVFPQKPMDIGLSGITIGTDSDDFLLEMGVTCNDTLDNAFHRLLLFHKTDQPSCRFACLQSKDPKAVEASRDEIRDYYHRIRPGESLWSIARTLGVSVNQLKSWNGLRSNLIHPNGRLKYRKKVRSAIPLDPAMLDTINTISYQRDPRGFDEFLFEDPQDTVLIGFRGNERIELNGMYVENNKRGIVYSMIGVNGAKYEHYNKSANFFDQLAALENDLIIVSLGTNESLADNYTPELIRKQMGMFYQRIRELNPGAQILVCTNPNTYSWRRKNPRSAEMNQAIIAFCEEEDLPYWDMYHLMGGSDGIYRWHKADLAQRDLIHFSAEGYRKMGALLYYSIMQAYHDAQRNATD